MYIAHTVPGRYTLKPLSLVLYYSTHSSGTLHTQTFESSPVFGRRRRRTYRNLRLEGKCKFALAIPFLYSWTPIIDKVGLSQFWLYVLILRAKDNQSIKCVSVSTRCRITNRCCYAVDCVLEFQIMFFMFS